MAEAEEATSSQHEQQQQKVRKAKINAIWEELNSRESAITAKAKNFLKTAARGETKSQFAISGEVGGKSLPEKKLQKTSCPAEWMVRLGISMKKHQADSRPEVVGSTGCENADTRGPTCNAEVQMKSEDKGVASHIAASSLAVVKAVTAVSKDSKPPEANTGEQLQSSQFLDTSRVSESNKRKAQMQATASSGLDALLEQIGKKQKANILDRSRKDWGEFKEVKGLEEELEAYKKSGDKYLDRVAFLQRAELREYEKERDARLAYQAKRRLETSSFTDT